MKQEIKQTSDQTLEENKKVIFPIRKRKFSTSPTHLLTISAKRFPFDCRKSQKCNTDDVLFELETLFVRENRNFSAFVRNIFYPIVPREKGIGKGSLFNCKYLWWNGVNAWLSRNFLLSDVHRVSLDCSGVPKKIGRGISARERPGKRRPEKCVILKKNNKLLSKYFLIALLSKWMTVRRCWWAFITKYNYF